MEPMEAKDGKDRYEGLIVSKNNKVLHIQFNRPERKNAVTLQMYYGLASALREAAKDPEVNVAVLTGNGNDLGNFTKKLTPEEAERFEKEKPFFNLVRAFIDFPKPLIALVNGPAIGVAVTLLGLCDAVYCSDKATFQTPFTQLAQSAEGCSSYVFPRLMGTAKATEILLFNRKITAQEAYDRNLVTRVFPDADFRKETEAVLSYIVSLPPQSSEVADAILAFFSRKKSKL
ncbi:hypothetical protein ACOMHN_051125 [Nucella lapillus]